MSADARVWYNNDDCHWHGNTDLNDSIEPAPYLNWILKFIGDSENIWYWYPVASKDGQWVELRGYVVPRDGGGYRWP